MKKLIIIFIGMLFFLTILTPNTEAATQNLKYKNLKLPYLYNYTNAKALKNGTYKFYGIGIGNTKKFMVSSWGNPNYSSTSRDGMELAGYYYYGVNENLTVAAYSKNRYTSTNNLKIQSITISDRYKRYELSKVKKYFGTPSSTFTSDGYKYYHYGDILMICFVKSNGKWYVEDIDMTKYS